MFLHYHRPVFRLQELGRRCNWNCSCDVCAPHRIKHPYYYRCKTLACCTSRLLVEHGSSTRRVPKQVQLRCAWSQTPYLVMITPFNLYALSSLCPQCMNVFYESVSSSCVSFSLDAYTTRRVQERVRTVLTLPAKTEPRGKRRKNNSHLIYHCNTSAPLTPCELMGCTSQ
jgi:hypothetical protein